MGLYVRAVTLTQHLVLICYWPLAQVRAVVSCFPPEFHFLGDQTEAPLEIKDKAKMLRLSLAPLRVGSFSAMPAMAKARGFRSHRMVKCYSTSFGQSSKKLLFRQLFEQESSTYTYLLADVSHPDKPALVRFCFLNLVWLLLRSRTKRKWEFWFSIVWSLIWIFFCSVFSVVRELALMLILCFGIWL